MEQNHNRTSVFTMPLVRVIMLVMLVLLLINQNFLPAGLIIFIFLIVEISRLWCKLSLRYLDIQHSIFPIRLFPDEEMTLKIEINNKKWLPVNIRWTQAVIPEIKMETLSNKEGSNYLSGQRLLGWHDKTSSKYKLKALKRGYYELPPLQIQAQDGLGLFENRTALGNSAIIVYPRIRSLEDLELNPSDLIGDRKDKRPLLPDPIRIAGLRDYTPDMPARFINWKASAHKDELLAKLLEPSADLRVCITVDVETFQPLSDDGAFEEALSVAASLAYWAENNRIPFALIANGKQKGFDSPVVIPMSGAPNHIGAAFEALARLELIHQGKLSDLIKMESANFPWGTTLIMIAKGSSLPVSSSLRNVVYYNIDKENGQ